MIFFMDDKRTYHNISCVQKICPQFCDDSMYFSVKIEDPNVMWVYTPEIEFDGNKDDFEDMEVFYKRFVCNLNDF